MKRVRVTLRCDGDGLVRITTVASSVKAAVENVLIAERAPRRAIVRVVVRRG